MRVDATEIVLSSNTQINNSKCILNLIFYMSKGFIIAVTKGV